MIRMNLTAAAACLNAHVVGDDTEFSGCSTDSRKVHTGELFVALRGERWDGHEFTGQARQRGAAAVMAERDVGAGLPCLRVDDSLLGLGRLAGCWRDRFDIPLLGVTGSNGKTTVRQMLTAILAEQGPVHSTCGNFNNAIGVPLTLFGLNPSHQAAVIEMGANHIGEIAQLTQLAKPKVAVITQCVSAHLEGFGSLQGVAKAKGELISGLAADGVAVLNADDSFVDYWRRLAKPRSTLTFGLAATADVTGSWSQNASGVVIQARTPTYPIELQLPLLGRHNVANALAAITAAYAVGVPANAIKAGLARMRPVGGRLEPKVGMNGVRILDDTYNANPGSLRAAIEVLAGLAGPRWLVLGDMAELGPDTVALHAQSGEFAAQHHLSGFYSLGSLSAFATARFGSPARHFNCYQRLIEALMQNLPDDAVVLVKGSRSMQMERVVSALSGIE